MYNESVYQTGVIQYERKNYFQNCRKLDIAQNLDFKIKLDTIIYYFYCSKGSKFVEVVLIFLSIHIFTLLFV